VGEWVKYILIESKKQKAGKITLEKTGEIKMTLHKFERILKRAKAIESKNNGP
jgi:hypothetical protein